jgi:hypothetical protein
MAAAAAADPLATVDLTTDDSTPLPQPIKSKTRPPTQPATPVTIAIQQTTLVVGSAAAFQLRNSFAITMNASGSISIQYPNTDTSQFNAPAGLLQGPFPRAILHAMDPSTNSHTSWMPPTRPGISNAGTVAIINDSQQIVFINLRHANAIRKASAKDVRTHNLNTDQHWIIVQSSHTARFLVPTSTEDQHRRVIQDLIHCLLTASEHMRHTTTAREELPAIQPQSNP